METESANSVIFHIILAPYQSEYNNIEERVSEYLWAFCSAFEHFPFEVIPGAQISEDHFYFYGTKALTQSKLKKLLGRSNMY